MSNNNIISANDYKGTNIEKALSSDNIEKGGQELKKGEIGVTAFDMIQAIEKGGEGSRGGKIIGHTKSGKPVYAVDRHKYGKDFSIEDHKDAANIHSQQGLHHQDQKSAAHRAGDDEDYDHHHQLSHHHAVMTAEHVHEASKMKKEARHPDEKKVIAEAKKKQIEDHHEAHLLHAKMAEKWKDTKNPHMKEAVEHNLRLAAHHKSEKERLEKE